MGITDPAEEYFKDGLWGWVSSAWKKLAAEAAGQLHVYLAGQAADIEVTQTAPADLQVGLSGYYGAAWQKLAMVWGFSGQYVEKEQDTDVASGNHALQFSACPAGTARVILGLTAYNNATAVSRTELQLWVGGTSHVLETVLLPAARVPAVLSRPVVLLEDDYVRSWMVGCALNDDIVAAAWGYDMSLSS